MVQHMGVDHGGSDGVVAEPLLHRADVIATLESVGGITGPQASMAEPLGTTKAVRSGGLPSLCLDQVRRIAFCTRLGSR
jgi:hypothetical protein